MKPRHLLLTLLVAANVAVALLLATAPELLEPLWPGWTWPATAGLIFGQIATASAWLVFGRPVLVARLLLVAACVPLWALWGSQAGNSSFGEWMTLILVYGGILTLALIAARMLRETNTGRPATLRSAPAKGARRWQFSIAHLFGVTTIVAVLAAAVRWLNMPLILLTGTLVTCLVMAAATLLTLGICARRPRLTTIVILLAVVCPSALGALTLLVPVYGEYVAWTLVISAHAGCIAVSVWVAYVADRADRFADARAQHPAAAVEGQTSGTA